MAQGKHCDGRLRTRRKERFSDQSLRAFAERVGIDQGYLSRLERGEVNPSTDQVARIAAALEVKPETVLRDVLADREAARAAAG